MSFAALAIFGAIAANISGLPSDSAKSIAVYGLRHIIAPQSACMASFGTYYPTKQVYQAFLASCQSLNAPELSQQDVAAIPRRAADSGSADSDPVNISPGQATVISTLISSLTLLLSPVLMLIISSKINRLGHEVNSMNTEIREQLLAALKVNSDRTTADAVQNTVQAIHDSLSGSTSPPKE